MPASRSPLGRPEDARAALCEYVRALHEAYLSGARLLAPGERAALPLLTADALTVVVAAAGDLHLIGTTARLPTPAGPEVAEPGEAGPMRWTVRFYDPVVLPELGMIAAAAGQGADAVRRVLGISDVIYHLTVGPGGGLTAHHAMHAGTALVSEHAAAARDGEALRAMLPGRAGLVDEFVTAERLGMRHSLRLLAAELAGDDQGVAEATSGADDAAVRRAVLAAVRRAAGRGTRAARP